MGKSPVDSGIVGRDKCQLKAQIDSERRRLDKLTQKEAVQLDWLKVLGNPGFFVFDDATLHLNEERKALIVDFIRQLAEEHQVVVTSYDEGVRAGLEGAHLFEMHAL